MKRRCGALRVLLFVVAFAEFGPGCSLVPLAGYFHLVTAIRGRIVGKNLGPFQFRWLRQSFGVSSASLTLHEYRWPAKTEDLRLIAKTETDSHGHFDFGRVTKGHYVLAIQVKDTDLMGGSYAVEVTDKVKPTDNVVIDVSPIRRDCTGGHEFIETKGS